MSFLGGLFGKKQPDPPGTTYFVDHGGSTADSFQVKRVLPGQSQSDPHLKVLESFDDYMSAADNCDHATSGTLKDFRYHQAAMDVGTRDDG
jgi:hypothetical protein